MISESAVVAEAEAAAELAQRTQDTLASLGRSNYQPVFGPLGSQVYKRTYSNTKNGKAIMKALMEEKTPPKNLSETFAETIVRMVDGNLSLVDQKFIERDERASLINMFLDMDLIAGGRHMSSSGLPGRQFIANCHSAGFDYDEPWAHFTFLFDQLMQGGGVGSNYSNRYIEKLPPITKSIDLHITCRRDHPNINEFVDALSDRHPATCSTNEFLVPDSREGWVAAIEFLMRAAFDKNEHAQYATNGAGPVGTSSQEICLNIDVSEIRAKGMPLVSSGGIACGPQPLVFMLRDVVKILNSRVEAKLTSLDVMSLDHAIAACVVAGGKRRSSRMAVKSWKDADIFDFINCKRTDGTHWTTNISVEIDDEFIELYQIGNGTVTHGHALNRALTVIEPDSFPSVTCQKCGLRIRADCIDTCIGCDTRQALQVVRAVILGKRLNGEPGFWNRSLSMRDEREPEEMFSPNPCGEILKKMWESCIIGHVNLQNFAKRSRRETMQAFRLMARFLVRATFGDMPQQRQKEVVSKNRRIGVGFLGFSGWLALRGIKYSECWSNKKIQEDLGYFHLKVVDAATDYAETMGIPVPAKFTCVAPTGTMNNIPGVDGGCQATKMLHGKRRVRYFNEDPELALRKAEGYPVYPDPDAMNTSIVEYWFEHPLVAKLRANGWNPDEVLETEDQVSFRDNLEVQAMIQECFADNGISFTINMTEEQLPSEEQMEKDLMEVLPRLKGATVYVDKSRKNSPFERVTKAEFDAYTGPKEVSQVEDECRTGCPVK